MKKSILFFLIFISFRVVAQEKPIAVKTDSLASQVSEKWMKHTPGQELVLASSKYYTGLTLQVIGSVLVGLGSISENDDYKTANNFLKIMGGSLSLVGVGIEISSFIHVKRAGILMDRKKN